MSANTVPPSPITPSAAPSQSIRSRFGFGSSRPSARMSTRTTAIGTTLIQNASPPREEVDQHPAEQRADQERARGPRRPAPDRAALLGLGERGDDERERARHEEGARCALQRPADDEHDARRRERAEHRRRGEAVEADADDAEPAERVRQRAREQDERAERQQVRVDRPLLQGESAAELVRDRRQRHVDDGAVEERDERDDDGDDEHPGATVHPPMLAQAADEASGCGIRPASRRSRQRLPSRRRSRSMRACSWVTVACATAGPPHTRRSSACTWECASPVCRAHRPTRLLSSERCSFSVR